MPAFAVPSYRVASGVDITECNEALSVRGAQTKMEVANGP